MVEKRRPNKPIRIVEELHERALAIRDAMGREHESATFFFNWIVRDFIKRHEGGRAVRRVAGAASEDQIDQRKAS